MRYVWLVLSVLGLAEVLVLFVSLASYEFDVVWDGTSCLVER